MKLLSFCQKEWKVERQTKIQLLEKKKKRRKEKSNLEMANEMIKKRWKKMKKIVIVMQNSQLHSKERTVSVAMVLGHQMELPVVSELAVQEAHLFRYVHLIAVQLSVVAEQK